MSKKFHLKILTPDKIIFDGETESVVLPTTEGEMELLANHSAIITDLAMGHIRCTTDGQKTSYKVDSGLMHFADNQLVINTSSATKE